MPPRMSLSGRTIPRPSYQNLRRTVLLENMRKSWIPIKICFVGDVSPMTVTCMAIFRNRILISKRN
eukprot:scaffold38008_cov50-Attheya_sp.AAC.1